MQKYDFNLIDASLEIFWLKKSIYGNDMPLFLECLLTQMRALEDKCDRSYFKQLTKFFGKFTDVQS